MTGTSAKMQRLAVLAADVSRTEWRPVSRVALVGWSAFFVLFLWHAATTPLDFRWIDNANFVMHEAGHLLFSWLGYKVGIAGGTIFQFAVPAMLALYFRHQRQLPGAAFAVFFLFENFLYSATYIADARAQQLDLLSVGGGDAEHDWYTMLLWFGMLEWDLALARAARFIGWTGMVGTIAWYVRAALRSAR